MSQQQQQPESAEDQQKRRQAERDRSTTAEIPAPRRTLELPSLAPRALVTVERPRPLGPQPRPAVRAKRKKT